MEIEVTKPPRDLRYSERHGEVYEKLRSEQLSPFNGSTYKDIFLYALAYGYRHGYREPLEKGQPNIPLSAFSEEERWIAKAIAIDTADTIEVLSDERRVYEIAEEYANGALDAIFAEIFGGKPGEPYKRMVQDIWEEYERLQHSD